MPGIVIDTHAHLYPLYSLTRALEGAVIRLQKARSEYLGVIVMDREGQDSRSLLSTMNEISEGPEGTLHFTSACGSLTLFLGYQRATRDGLEILTLGGSRPANERVTFEQAYKRSEEEGAIAILPWSFGKWWGKRAGIVSSVLKNHPELIIGDIPLRVHGAAVEQHAGHCVVYGSDPYPVSGEEESIGTFASHYVEGYDPLRPMSSLQTLLRSSGLCFGQKESWGRAISRYARHELSRRTRGANAV